MLSPVKCVGAVFPAVAILVSGLAAPARAQTIVAGGAAELGVERFNGEAALNRLDGMAAGWTLLGGVQFGRVAARVEAWRDAAIEDTDTTSLVTNGRTVTIHSSLAHDAHAVAALGGYVQDVSSRVQVAGFGGVSYITIARTFTSDAGQVLLVSPSPIPAGPTATHTVDRFVTWTVGADVGFRATDRLRLFAGLRSEPLRLEIDISGISVRLLAGAVWMIR
jgi:hypothetical protein